MQLANFEVLQSMIVLACAVSNFSNTAIGSYLENSSGICGPVVLDLVAAVDASGGKAT